MISDYIDDLLRIYSEYETGVIQKEPAYRQMCDEYKERDEFNEIRHMIHDLKEYLEHLIKDAEIKEQVSRLIRRMRIMLKQGLNADMHDYCIELILKSCKMNWGEARTKYFVSTVNMFKENEYDYFLSFTRKCSSNHTKQVNQDYIWFVRRELDYGKREYENYKCHENLLAVSIHKILKRDNDLQGYFYPECAGVDNPPVDRLLERGLDGCILFIQLIQKIMFTQANYNDNYCYREFVHIARRFGTDMDSRIRYIIAHEKPEDFVEDESSLASSEYAEWYSHVKSKDYVFIPKCDKYFTQQEVCVAQDLIDRIRQSVLRHRYNLINNVP